MMPIRTFRFPEQMEDEEQVAYHLKRLKSFLCGQYIYHVRKKIEIHQRHIDWYNKTDFKGRYKTHIMTFHERAKVLILKHIYDKSRSQRKTDGH